MASSACLLEPFRNQPAGVEIRSCLLKLFSIHTEMQRKARREENSLSRSGSAALVGAVAFVFSLAAVSIWGDSRCSRKTTRHDRQLNRSLIWCP